jgi:hypothetical protein
MLNTVNHGSIPNEALISLMFTLRKLSVKFFDGLLITPLF